MKKVQVLSSLLLVAVLLSTLCLAQIDPNNPDRLIGDANNLKNKTVSTSNTIILKIDGLLIRISPGLKIVFGMPYEQPHVLAFFFSVVFFFYMIIFCYLGLSFSPFSKATVWLMALGFAFGASQLKVFTKMFLFIEDFIINYPLWLKIVILIVVIIIAFLLNKLFTPMIQKFKARKQAEAEQAKKEELDRTVMRAETIIDPLADALVKASDDDGSRHLPGTSD